MIYDAADLLPFPRSTGSTEDQRITHVSQSDGSGCDGAHSARYLCIVLPPTGCRGLDSVAISNEQHTLQYTRSLPASVTRNQSCHEQSVTLSPLILFSHENATLLPKKAIAIGCIAGKGLRNTKIAKASAP